MGIFKEPGPAQHMMWTARPPPAAHSALGIGLSHGDPYCPTHEVVGLGSGRKSGCAPVCTWLRPVLPQTCMEHLLCTSPHSGHRGRICKENRQELLSSFYSPVWGRGRGPRGQMSAAAKGRLSGAIIFEPENKGVSVFVCLCLGGRACPGVYRETTLGWAEPWAHQQGL